MEKNKNMIYHVYDKASCKILVCVLADCGNCAWEYFVSHNYNSASHVLLMEVDRIGVPDDIFEGYGVYTCAVTGKKLERLSSLKA